MALPVPALDAEPARWATELLTSGRWGLDVASESVQVSSLIPPIYEAYCRIFHPQDRDDDQGNHYLLPWSEAAIRHGRTLHHEAHWFKIVGAEGLTNPMDELDDSPMPSEWLDRLAVLLHRHTSTPDRCWFGVWPGYSPRGRPQAERGPMVPWFADSDRGFIAIELNAGESRTRDVSRRWRLAVILETGALC